MARIGVILIAENKFAKLQQQITGNKELKNALRTIEFKPHTEADSGAGVGASTDPSNTQDNAAFKTVKDFAAQKDMPNTTRAALADWLLDAFRRGRLELVPIMTALLKSNKTKQAVSDEVEIMCFQCDDAHMALACELIYHYLCQDPLNNAIIYPFKVTESYDPNALLIFLGEKFTENPQASGKLLKKLAQTETLIGNKIIIEAMLRKQLTKMYRLLNSNSDIEPVVQTLVQRLFAEQCHDIETPLDEASNSQVEALFNELGFSSFAEFNPSLLGKQTLPVKILHGKDKFAKRWSAHTNKLFAKETLLRLINEEFPNAIPLALKTRIQATISLTRARLTHSQSILAKKRNKALIGFSSGIFIMFAVLFIGLGAALLKYRSELSKYYGISLIAAGVLVLTTGCFFTRYVSSVKNEKMLSLPNDATFIDFYNKVRANTDQLHQTTSTSNTELTETRTMHQAPTVPNLELQPDSPLRAQAHLDDTMPLQVQRDKPRARRSHDYMPHRPSPLGLT